MVRYYVTAADALGRTNREPLFPGDPTFTLEDAERNFIEKVLARHNGDVRLAAQQLGMSRSALYRRLQQYDVRS